MHATLLEKPLERIKQTYIGSGVILERKQVATPTLFGLSLRLTRSLTRMAFTVGAVVSGVYVNGVATAEVVRLEAQRSLVVVERVESFDAALRFRSM